MARVKNLTWLAMVPFNPTSEAFLFFSFTNVFIGSNFQGPLANCKLPERADFIILSSNLAYWRKDVVRIVFSNNVHGYV